MGYLLTRGFHLSVSYRFAFSHSWKTQPKPCAHQNPGKTYSHPTRDWPTISFECSGVSGGGVGQQCPAARTGALSGTVCAGDFFEGGRHYLHYLQYSLVRSDNREGTQPRPSTENCIKVLLSMVPPIRIRPSFPYNQSLLSGSFHSLVSLSLIGHTEWKPQSQRTIQIDHVDHSLV